MVGRGGRRGVDPGTSGPGLERKGAMAMIARIWRGVTPTEKADAYLGYLERWCDCTPRRSRSSSTSGRSRSTGSSTSPTTRTCGMSTILASLIPSTARPRCHFRESRTTGWRCTGCSDMPRGSGARWSASRLSCSTSPYPSRDSQQLPLAPLPATPTARRGQASYGQDCRELTSTHEKTRAHDAPLQVRPPRATLHGRLRAYLR